MLERISTISYLLVLERRGKVKDEGSKTNNSEYGEKGTSEVTVAGDNHAGGGG